ncbi:MAG: hypothetical protein JWN12_645 [Candidatus Saccharibacteria bacterium]|nr:hypothetical protein [Candidatus Saccharibacteria bacterium]
MFFYVHTNNRTEIEHRVQRREESGGTGLTSRRLDPILLHQHTVRFFPETVNM